MDQESPEPQEYYVEKVLDKKVVDGEVRYLIKWEGWSIDDSTWEPIENLGNIKNLIEEFEAELLEKKKKGGSGTTKQPVGRPRQNPNSFAIKKKADPNYDLDDELNSRINKKKDDIMNNTRKKTENDVEVMSNLGANVPEEVISVKRDKGKEIMCLVKFKERADGIIIDNSYVPSSVMREYYPKVLIKFYESKIKFVDKK
jgi:chromobox protein 5